MHYLDTIRHMNDEAVIRADLARYTTEGYLDGANRCRMALDGNPAAWDWVLANHEEELS